MSSPPKSQTMPQRLTLIAQPTGLEPLPRLSRHLGSVNIWVKRDDQTGIAFGGNKVRKLEFLLAEAVAHGADTLVTIGGLQSNHCRQTAAVAARLGLGCHLLLLEGSHGFESPAVNNGNLLLDHLLGATLQILPSDVHREAAMATANSELIDLGKRPYLIPAGGSTALGTLGYVLAADELLVQCDRAGVGPVALIHSSGSGGTQAGLICGLAAAGRSIDVIGMSCGKSSVTLAAIVDELARAAAPLVPLSPSSLPGAVVDDRFIGPGYGIADEKTWEAIMMAARLEGLLLDPVYSGKAMAGLIAEVNSGRFDSGADIIFLHTGGAPALFAYGAELGGIS